MEQICDICVERHACHVPCSMCELKTCRKCARRLVSEHTHNTSCVGCQKEWDADEAVARLGRTFWLTDYRVVRRDELFRTESVLLPGTIEQAHHVRREQTLTENIRDLQTRVRNGEWDRVPDLRAARILLYHHRNGTIGGSDRRGQWIVRNCSYTNCTGYVSATGECTTCRRFTCMQCGESRIDDRHVCSEETLNSMREIAGTCRPCVRCNAPCTRAEGCSTMWCVQCHTFWNWETGRVIDTSRGHAPHNPDHRRYIANVRLREVDDIPCGGIPDGGMLHVMMIHNMNDDISSTAPVILEATESIYRAQRMRGRYPRTWDPMTMNVNSRISLINGEMDEIAFKKTIERNERCCQYKRCVGEQLETFVISGSYILQRFCNGDESIDSTAIELIALREVIDASLSHTSLLYNRTVPRISSSWRWTVPNARSTTATFG